MSACWSWRSRVGSRMFLWLCVGFMVFSFTIHSVLLAQSDLKTVVRSVIQSSDDSGEYYNGGYWTSHFNEIYVGESLTGQDLTSGFRFQNVDLEQGATVDNARLEFTLDGPYTTPIHIRFYGEAADHSETFTDPSKPTDRALTNAYVDWQLTADSLWEWTKKGSTPDLSAIVQEIVNRPGWQAGNALSIIVKNVESSSQHRRVYAYDREGVKSSAKLIINTPPPPDYDVYTMQPRVWVINFDPLMPSMGNQRLHAAMGWFEPEDIVAEYRSDIEHTSYGIVDYDITTYFDVDFFPIKQDGFQYTNADASTPGSYLYAREHNDWHSPDLVDYSAIVRDYDLARKVQTGVVDEVWLHGGPYFGYYESRMVGEGGYWCNSPELNNVSSSKIFIFMGFNYERADNGLHILGHRTESIMSRVYGSWSEDSTHAWNRFTLHDKMWPDGAACGNTHYAPNSDSDYDYGNDRYVWSTHRDWLENYPNLTGEKEWVNCSEWGNGDTRLFHNWWFEHIPHVAGTTTEYGKTRSNNWWNYIADFNQYPESGSTLARGFYSAPVDPNAVFYEISACPGDEWSPQINTEGRVVWYGFDGHDYEIYSAFANGTGVVQITDNSLHDENPILTETGYIVWQAFDGTDFEIFMADAWGNNVVQITDNAGNDWHPHMNNKGEIVWDGWDGDDYEIYVYDLDTQTVRQLTDNQASSGYPRNDQWPQINDNSRVVWMGFDGEDWDILTANADGSDARQISSSEFHDEYPQINNHNQVVWQVFHDEVNTEIHTAMAVGASTDRIITTNPLEDWYPQINNNGTVVWMGHNGWNWDIYTSDFEGNVVTRLTHGPTDFQYPHIDDTGFITWQGHDGEDWEIFGYSENSIQQLSDNQENDYAPRTANHNTVWHSVPIGEERSHLQSAVVNFPVPVELATFDVHLQENNVILSWTTVSESNNLGFDVQRRAENESFVTLGFVKGQHTTTTEQSYTFVDEKPVPGISYYRLKQIDTDGTFQYSSELKVTAGVPETFALYQNYPNPFNPATTIRYALPTPTHVEMFILNALGQRVSTLVDAEQPAGYYDVIWDGTNTHGAKVSAGMYFCAFKSPEFTAVKKLLFLP